MKIKNLKSILAFTDSYIVVGYYDSFNFKKLKEYGSNYSFQEDETFNEEEILSIELNERILTIRIINEGR